LISDEKTDALFIISILWLEVQPLPNDPARPHDHPSRAACCQTTPQDDMESRASFYWNRATLSKTRGRRQALISESFRKPGILEGSLPGGGFPASVRREKNAPAKRSVVTRTPGRSSVFEPGDIVGEQQYLRPFH